MGYTSHQLPNARSYAVGTSLTVTPASSQCGFALRADVPLVIVNAEPTPYSFNVVDRVVHGLYQAGSALDPVEFFELGFDEVFDLGGWERAAHMEGQAYRFYLIGDVPWISDPGAIEAMGVEIAALVRAGKRVVVNCSAGLNRSGLLVGRMLIELGHTPAEAVELVRQARARMPCRTWPSRSSCSWIARRGAWRRGTRSSPSGGCTDSMSDPRATVLAGRICVAGRNIRSLDVVWEQARIERTVQLAFFDALDTKAGVVLGFAGAVVALAPAGSILIDIGRVAAVGSGACALWTVWPRRVWSTDLRALRDLYLPPDPPFARLRLLDTQIQIAETLGTVLSRKVMRLKLSMALLVVAAVLTTVGLGLE
jgi:hypothetical protein